MTPILSVDASFRNSIIFCFDAFSLFGYISSANIESEISSAIIMSALLAFTSTFPSSITGELKAITIKIVIIKKSIFLTCVVKLPPLTCNFFITSSLKKCDCASF